MNDIFFSGIAHNNDPIKTKALVEHFFNRPPEEPRGWVWQTKSNGIIVRTEHAPVNGTFVTEPTVYPKNGDKVSLRIRAEANRALRDKFDGICWMAQRANLIGVQASRVQADTKLYSFNKSGKLWRRRTFEFHIIGAVKDEQLLKQVMNAGYPSKMRCWGFGFVEANVL